MHPAPSTNQAVAGPWSTKASPARRGCALTVLSLRFGMAGGRTARGNGGLGSNPVTSLAMGCSTFGGRLSLVAMPVQRPMTGKHDGDLWLHWQYSVLDLPIGSVPNWGLILENPTTRTITWTSGPLAVTAKLRSLPSRETIRTGSLHAALVAGPAIRHSMSPGEARDVLVTVAITKDHLARLALGTYELTLDFDSFLSVASGLPEPLTLRVGIDPQDH